MNTFDVSAPSNWVPVVGVEHPDLTVSNAAKTLEDDQTFNDKTERIFMTVEDQPVRITFDGSAPVGGSHGHRYVAGSTFTLRKAMARAVKIIRDGASDAKCTITECYF